jgi:hypothetical protein
MVKILQVLDALFYEAVVWSVLTPKTLIKTIIHPRWIMSYVRQELQKNPEDRYTSYMPPVTFFMVTAVLPVIGLRNLNVVAYEHSLYMRVTGLTVESQILVLALYYAATPLLCSLAILKLRRIPIDRISLRPTFHAQCLIWATSFMLLFFLLIPIDPAKRSVILVITLVVGQWLVVGWTLYAETVVLSAELKTDRWSAFGFSLLILIGTNILMYPVIHVLRNGLH